MRPWSLSAEEAASGNGNNTQFPKAAFFLCSVRREQIEHGSVRSTSSIAHETRYEELEVLGLLPDTECCWPAYLWIHPGRTQHCSTVSAARLPISISRMGCDHRKNQLQQPALSMEALQERKQVVLTQFLDISRLEGHEFNFPALDGSLGHQSHSAYFATAACGRNQICSAILRTLFDLRLLWGLVSGDLPMLDHQ